MLTTSTGSSLNDEEPNGIAALVHPLGHSHPSMRPLVLTLLTLASPGCYRDSRVLQAPPVTTEIQTVEEEATQTCLADGCDSALATLHRQLASARECSEDSDCAPIYPRVSTLDQCCIPVARTAINTIALRAALECARLVCGHAKTTCLKSECENVVCHRNLCRLRGFEFTQGEVSRTLQCATEAPTLTRNSDGTAAVTNEKPSRSFGVLDMGDSRQRREDIQTERDNHTKDDQSSWDALESCAGEVSGE